MDRVRDRDMSRVRDVRLRGLAMIRLFAACETAAGYWIKLCLITCW